MRILIRLLLLIVLVAAAAGAWILFRPAGPTVETFVTIRPGMSTNQIAALLEHEGILSNRYGFELLRISKRRTLKAGEYRFDHPAATSEVYDRLARGDVYTITVTIPEGYNIFDIARAMDGAKLVKYQDFLDAERADTGLISDLDPSAKTLEGYLFPDTYKFQRIQTAKEMLSAMVRRFRQQELALGLRSPVHDVITLASLVEKETPAANERGLVASVFHNRLQQRMALGTDPSIIYGALLQGRFRGTIYRSDLQADNAYNTYLHLGLPPGPICNPGVSSIRAAMSPAVTKYLYFVSDNAGHSKFSASLGEHDKNVAAYRQSVRAASDQR